VRRAAIALLLWSSTVAVSGSADELSGADKLRVVYSSQFAWTRDGLPIVTVRVMDHRSEVVLGGAGMRVLPDGDGGAEVKGGERWTVRVASDAGGGKPGKIRWNVIGGSVKAGDGDALQIEMQKWRSRGMTPRSLEIGALFAVKGAVLDSRKTLIAVDSAPSEDAGRKRAAELSQQFHVDAGVEPELIERPRGTIEAVDERGTVARNDSILWFVPAEGGMLELRDVDNERGQKETRKYFGKLYVTLDNDGKLTVVNAVPEDKLLAGLVPAEMSASSPPEALKAQAVAARNELLAKIGTRHLTDPYRLCSTQHCQVYAGAGREDARATAAVAATRGELLMRDGGGLVDAVYSASCGGHGENNEHVWGGAPDSSLRGILDGDGGIVQKLARFAARVADDDVREFLALGTAGDGPWCARPKEAQTNYRWKKEIDVAALTARAGVGAIGDVKSLARGVSGRVIKLRVAGKTGSADVDGELRIRKLLGNLKSGLFVLDAERAADGSIIKLVATGGGHGHGVGMCQTGAVGMAQAGKSYGEILRHYYQAAHLQKLY
jgi:stage II sporulation protein D